MKLSKIDPRLFLIFNNFSIIIGSIYIFGSHRYTTAVIFSVAAAYATELALLFALKKYKQGCLLDRFLSCCASGMSIVLLLRSNHLWIYVLLASVAIISKYIFLIGNKDKLFNPTNFSIVFIFSLIPNTYFFIHPDNISLHTELYLFAIINGIIATSYAKRLLIPITYFFWLMIFSILSHLNFAQINILNMLLPELSIASVIFLFFMATDPKTTPSNPWAQILFSTLLFILAFCFRSNQIYYSQFLALFLICPIFKIICDLIFSNKPLQVRKVVI
jgi:enediyne biosynthesis protein E5